MSTILEAVAEVAASQKPVLCLDTCDFLDVVRGTAREGPSQARAFRKAADVLAADPDRLQVIITYLVRHEWAQNIAEVRDELSRYLKETDERIGQIIEACGLGGGLAPAAGVGFSGLPLAGELVTLAERLMDQAITIDRDDGCVERALARVMERRRPSHKREIKDSIHWEHSLEFSRRLGGAGHAGRRIFISANKADFWADKHTSRIHPDLDGEANAAGLSFHGKLNDALRELGI